MSSLKETVRELVRHTTGQDEFDVEAFDSHYESNFDHYDWIKRLRLLVGRLEEQAGSPTCYILMRNEQENGRRVYVGLFSSRIAAEQARSKNIEEYERIYDEDDYDVLETTLEQ